MHLQIKYQDQKVTLIISRIANLWNERVAEGEGCNPHDFRYGEYIGLEKNQNASLCSK